MIPPHKGEGDDGMTRCGTDDHRRASLPLWRGSDGGWVLVVTRSQPSPHHPNPTAPGGHWAPPHREVTALLVGNHVLFAELIDQGIVIGLDDFLDLGAIEQV